MHEIERKFLVDGDFKNFAIKSYRITQGYLNSTPERAVRVRIKGDLGYLTIKGQSDSGGIRRFEWEKEISPDEANQLLKLCEPGIIDKTRYIVPSGKHEFEVDEFYGENDGLVIAEVELNHEDEKFEKPAWIGKEVSGDKRYFNAMLKQNPYKSWK